MKVQYLPLTTTYTPEELFDLTRRKPTETTTMHHSKIRAVALDLDGTLLHSKDHQISSASVEYLRKLDAHGIQIIIATGRPGPNVMQHVLRLNLPKPLPVVCSNGARGLLCQALPNGKVDVKELFSSPVPLDITKRVIRFADGLGHAVQFYNSSSVYTNASQKHHYELTNKYSENSGCDMTYIHDSFRALLNANELPSKLLVLCPREEMDETYSLFTRTFHKSEVSLVGGKNRKWYLEMLCPGVSKGNGLERMCKALNLRTDECVAFGDGSNDLEFLHVAGLGIAMKNAKVAVQNAADEVTQYTNNEDGVRRALQRMERNGRLQTMPFRPLTNEIAKPLTKEVSDEVHLKSHVSGGCFSCIPTAVASGG